MQYYKFFFSRFSWHEIKYYAAQIIMLSLIICLSIAIPYAQKIMFDSLTSTINMPLLIGSSTLLLFLGLFTALFTLLTQKLIHLFYEKISMEVFSRFLFLPRSVIEKRGAAYLAEKVVGDTNHIARMLSAHDIKFIFSIITVIIITAITLQWSNVFLYIIPLAYLFSGVVILFSSKLYSHYFSKGIEAASKLNPKIKAALDNSLAINYYANTENIINEINNDTKQRDKFSFLSMASNELGVVVSEFIKTTTRIILIFYLYTCIVNKTITFGVVIALLSYFEYIFLPIQHLQDAMDNWRDFPATKRRIGLDYVNNIGTMAIPDSMQSLKIKQCNYMYPQANKKCLDDISFIIENSCTGIVGMSGEGKSTLLKMISGELNIDSGICEFGNCNIAIIPKNYILSNIAFYGQNLELFNNDLQYNICLGKIPLASNTSKDEIVDALRKKFINQIDILYNTLHTNTKLTTCVIPNKLKAKLHDLFAMISPSALYSASTIEHTAISYLSEHKEKISGQFAKSQFSNSYYYTDVYNSVLHKVQIEYLSGRIFGEAGSSLSGGEKQRISLARFLLKDAADFFIIDEPFTSLDALSEKQCLKILHDALKARSGIIISHKLNIIKELTNNIIVLNEGKIIQQGTHDNLVEAHGLYNQLYAEFLQQRK